MACDVVSWYRFRIVCAHQGRWVWFECTSIQQHVWVLDLCIVIKYKRGYSSEPSWAHVLSTTKLLRLYVIWKRLIIVKVHYVLQYYVHLKSQCRQVSWSLYQIACDAIFCIMFSWRQEPVIELHIHENGTTWTLLFDLKCTSLNIIDIIIVVIPKVATWFSNICKHDIYSQIFVGMMFKFLNF